MASCRESRGLRPQLRHDGRGLGTNMGTRDLGTAGRPAGGVWVCRQQPLVIRSRALPWPGTDWLAASRAGAPGRRTFRDLRRTQPPQHVEGCPAGGHTAPGEPSSPCCPRSHGDSWLRRKQHLGVVHPALTGSHGAGPRAAGSESGLSQSCLLGTGPFPDLWPHVAPLLA